MGGERAKPALKGATVDESLLHWIEGAAFFKTLDSCDAGTVGVHCGINAAGHSLPSTSTVQQSHRP
jgi:hypothetical protein